MSQTYYHLCCLADSARRGDGDLNSMASSHRDESMSDAASAYHHLRQTDWHARFQRHRLPGRHTEAIESTAASPSERLTTKEREWQLNFCVSFWPAVPLESCMPVGVSETTVALVLWEETIVRSNSCVYQSSTRSQKPATASDTSCVLQCKEHV